ncbi:flavodoxin [Saccharopolyspora shandongensis]|uniref:flavodoxin n=1 Tax=Saccharopolyspora shandongensis TaxID=418495 RepID=UPI0033D69A81
MPTSADHQVNGIPAPLSRRELLGTALIGGISLTGLIAGCAPNDREPTAPIEEDGTTMPTGPNRKTLLAYFSRAGENYHDGGRRFLDAGNTEVLAELISGRIDCDVYRINPADPYPDSYDLTVARNVREQEDDARPAIAGPLPDIGRYGTILLGSPVWNVRAPMIMSTFVESLDLTGRTILPFVTYAVSGIGDVERDYRDMLPDTEIRTGLAVRGETVANAGPEVDAWLTEQRMNR